LVEIILRIKISRILQTKKTLNFFSIKKQATKKFSLNLDNPCISLIKSSQKNLPNWHIRREKRPCKRWHYLLHSYTEHSPTFAGRTENCALENTGKWMRLWVEFRAKKMIGQDWIPWSWKVKSDKWFFVWNLLCVWMCENFIWFFWLKFVANF
jgi:hypothetical protein